MKQHLSPNDLDKLPERIQDILTDYAIERGYHQSGVQQHEWWTIGRLFEYLLTQVMGDMDLELTINSVGSSLRLGLLTKDIIGASFNDTSDDPQLLDTLFQAVITSLEVNVDIVYG